MIKSISYWSIKGGMEGTRPIDEAMADAKSAGFAGIELAIAPEGVLTPSTDEKTCMQYRQAAEKRGLALQTLASGMAWAFSPTHVDSAVRKKSIDLHQAALQRAAWLGCKSMLFVPGAVTIPWNKDYPPVHYEQAYSWAKEAVRELAKVGEKVGVEVCVENVWNGFMYSPLEFRSFIDSIGSPMVGMYFDVGNGLGYHQYPPHWIEILGNRIKRVHIKEFKHNFDWNGNYSFGDLLSGDVPWKQTIAALKKVGYDKTLVAEMMPYSDGLLGRTSSAMDKILTM